jgi:hypothetical protein
MKKFLTLIVATLMLVSVLATGCTPADPGTVTGDPTPFEMVEGVHYSQQFSEDRPNDRDFDESVFYRNDVTFTCADPFVFRCEDPTDPSYGTYFLWGTTGVGVFNCFSSKDLVSWQPKNGAYVWPTDGWQQSNCWAPEVIWDPMANPEDYGIEDDGVGQGTYFIFASASPHQTYETLNRNDMVLDLGVSANPFGPFYAYNGNELGTVVNGVDYGEEANYAQYTMYKDAYNAGTHKGYVVRKGNQITNDDPWWNSVAAMAALDYQWENKDLAGEIGPDGNIVNPAAAYMVINEGSCWFTCIDPTPFLDYNEMVTKTDGTNTWEEPKKYLFFTRDQSLMTGAIGYDGEESFHGTCVYACEMVNNDWAQVDYNSLVRITRTNYNATSQKALDDYVEDAKNFNASAFAKGHQEIAPTAEESEYNANNRYTLQRNDVEIHVTGGNGSINEGSQMWYNEETGLYYLAISIGSYTNNTYTVQMLVSYNVTGPYRKLELKEGGLVISTNNGESMDNVTGPGHHTFYQCGPDLLIFYHRHIDLKVSGSNRGYCVDRITWTQNDDGMTVMHVNGPTTSIQPKLYGTGTTKYDIISQDATVTTNAKNCNDVNYINDRIIQIHNQELVPHIKPFKFFDKQVVITMTFDDYRTLKALQIYNSKNEDSSFLNISKIEFDAKIDGKEGVVYIKDLAFNWDRAMFESGFGVRAAYSADAIFEEMLVKEVRITIDNLNDVESGYSGYVEVPEIYLIGIPNA